MNLLNKYIFLIRKKTCIWAVGENTNYTFNCAYGPLG